MPKHKPILSSAPKSAAEEMALLDPSIDPETMAPSTLVLALRKQRRELKRAQRSENRRANLRASTLRTEEEILEKERQSKENPNRKGRKAMHEGGEVRGVRPMTQDELIAAALEEEERNKESLRDWLRREEERRELRRVGRKRVRGPRWTWVSRTVGKAVEVVETVEATAADSTMDMRAAGNDAQPGETSSTLGTVESPPAPLDGMTEATSQPLATDPPSITNPAAALEADTADPNDSTFPYTRNYLILSQVLGGLPTEFGLILGAHTDWSEVKHIPARNRPLVRKPPICPFTGLPVKYRHPGTGIGYATVEGYKMIEELLRHEYVWSDAGWVGREDEWLDEVGEWEDAVNGGWRCGERIEQAQESEEDVEMVEEVDEEVVVTEVPAVQRMKPGPKPKNKGMDGAPKPGKGKKGRASAVAPPDTGEDTATIAESSVTSKGKGKKAR